MAKLPIRIKDLGTQVTEDFTNSNLVLPVDDLTDDTTKRITSQKIIDDITDYLESNLGSDEPTADTVLRSGPNGKIDESWLPDVVLTGKYEITTLSQLENFVYAAPTAGEILVAENDVIVNRSTGSAYLVLASGAVSDVLGYTVRVQVLGTVNPDAFSTIEQAIAVASQSSRSIRGTPGRTYTFTTGVTVTGNFIADFTGCTLRRGASMADRSVVRVAPPLSAETYADADDVLAYSVAEFDYGNGATFVPRITVADTGAYAVGQIVKVLSSDKIPCSAPWEDTRYAESGEIGAIDAGDGYLYLIRPFCETWTPEKIVRLTATECDIVGGTWEDEEGYPAARKAPLVELHGVVRPRCRSMHLRDTASTQLQLLSCYEPVSLGNRFDNPRNSISNNAYGYGEKLIGCTRPVQTAATGSGCRHIWDTGGVTVADADLATSDPLHFGGVMEGYVADGVGYDSSNAPFNDHPDAFSTVFVNCRSLYTNRRSSGASLTGLQLRGRKSRAIGGVYEGIKPFQAEPSTNDQMVLKGVTFLKYPFGETDVAREPAFHVIGAGVASGRAKIKVQGCKFEQKFGRKEVILLQNTDMEIDASVDYEATLSNHVFARLETGSTLTIHGLQADFSASTAPTPMLTSLGDAASSIFAPGRVTIKGSPAGGSAIVLTDFNNLSGQADWRDVTGDGTFFDNESGWRNAGSAGLQRAVTRRSDTAAFSGDVTANFSGSSGAKTITWPAGAADPIIYAAINPTTTETFPGTVPAGSFIGQRLVLSNVGEFSFEVQTIGNISVFATRTVAVGASIVLRWSGANWTG